MYQKEDIFLHILPLEDIAKYFLMFLGNFSSNQGIYQCGLLGISCFEQPPKFYLVFANLVAYLALLRLLVYALLRLSLAAFWPR